MSLLARIDAARDRTLYAVLAALYLALACAWITLPGLYHDEVFFAPAALEIIHGDLGIDYQYRTEPFVWTVAGRKLPLMGLDYSSSLKAYLYVPFFLVLGYNAVAARLCSIAVGLLGVLWAFRFGREYLGRREGFLAALLLAVDPSYVLFCRVDYGLIPIAMAAKCGGLAFGARWWREGRAADAFLALLLLGAGLSSRADMLWMFNALGLALLFSGRTAFWRRLRPKALVAALAGLGLGGSAFFLWNGYYGGEIFKIWLRTLQPENESWLPDSPLKSADAFWSAAERKFEVLVRVLDGIFHGHMFNDLTPSWMAGLYAYAREWPAWVVGFGVLGAAALSFFASDRLLRRKLRALFLVLAAVFGQILMTPNATNGHHMMMAYPFLQLLLASAIVGLPGALPGLARPLRAAGAAALAVLALSWGTEWGRTFHGLLATGGTGHWSDSIYETAEYLREHPEWEVLQLDMSYNPQLQLLGEGKIRTFRAFSGYEDRTGRLWEPDKRSYIDPRMYGYFTRQNAVFLLRDPCCVGYHGPRNVFWATARASGADVEEIRSFAQRDGQIVTTLYRVTLPDAGAREVLSPTP